MYFYAYYGIHQTFSLVYMIRDFMILSNINVTGPWGRRQARITKGWHRGRKVGAEEVKDHTRITISSGYYTSKYVCKWYVFYFRSSLTLCIFTLLLTNGVQCIQCNRKWSSGFCLNDIYSVDSTHSGRYPMSPRKPLQVTE